MGRQNLGADLQKGIHMQSPNKIKVHTFNLNREFAT